jgi:hypothetical protein
MSGPYGYNAFAKRYSRQCPSEYDIECPRQFVADEEGEYARRFGTAERDFMSLDKQNKIGYNSKVRPGKRSEPCWEQYAAKSFFPIPYSLFPVPYSPVPPGMRRAGRKVHKFVFRETDKKSRIPRGAVNNSSKSNDQHANVYENKGQVWKTPGLSENVFENKGLSLSMPECN